MAAPHTGARPHAPPSLTFRRPLLVSGSVVRFTGLRIFFMGSRVVAIIPARFESTRLPGKPLADIDGKPMIQHVYERVSRSPVVTRTLVATDDRRIADSVKAFGGDVAWTKSTHRSGTDRIAEVAAAL